MHVICSLSIPHQQVLTHWTEWPYRPSNLHFAWNIVISVRNPSTRFCFRCRSSESWPPWTDGSRIRGLPPMQDPLPQKCLPHPPHLPDSSACLMPASCLPHACLMPASCLPHLPHLPASCLPHVCLICLICVPHACPICLPHTCLMPASCLPHLPASCLFHVCLICLICLPHASLICLPQMPASYACHICLPYACLMPALCLPTRAFHNKPSIPVDPSLQFLLNLGAPLHSRSGCARGTP